MSSIAGLLDRASSLPRPATETSSLEQRIASVDALLSNPPLSQPLTQDTSQLLPEDVAAAKTPRPHGAEDAAALRFQPRAPAVRAFDAPAVAPEAENVGDVPSVVPPMPALTAVPSPLSASLQIECLALPPSLARTPLDLLEEGVATRRASGGGVSPQAKLALVAPPKVPYMAVLTKKGRLSVHEVVAVLSAGEPELVREYSEHLFKIATLLYENAQLSVPQYQALETKLYVLMNGLGAFEDPDFTNSKLHVVAERNFDILVKLATAKQEVELSTRSVRFLTLVMMSLNYWEVYNLLVWKPAIYHFLTVIQYNMEESYQDFVRRYTAHTERAKLAREEEAKATKPRRRRGKNDASDGDDHDKFIADVLAGGKKKRGRPLSKPDVAKKATRGRPVGLRAHPSTPRKRRRSSNSDNGSPDPDNGGIKSSNYDPDVVHECQLPSADLPNRMCLRRFLRKYELIRHQETVHSKKKKLFKCYVCVKLSPEIGPRIFTRHDTLAKHIRVNHKISGKEAKAEVAFSKKHAEVVEEGDITVHVGRRKTKVDFELRAHMDKRKGSKDELIDSDEYYDDE